MSGGREVLLVTPAPPGSLSGNRVTARRWAGILRDLGHRVTVAEALEDRTPEVLVALHAARSAASVARYRERRPAGTGFLILALTGTDLYRDLAAGDAAARRSLALADRIVALHPLALDAVPEAFRPRVRVIVQSAEGAAAPRLDRGRPDRREGGVFRVCVAAHLRAVKDPLRAGFALSSLPPETAIEVVHLGCALEPELAAEARRLERAEPRYRWLGERSHPETRAILAGSQLVVITSLMEGAPNVLSEALAFGVPVAATRVPGCVGLLGSDHPGLFPVGDTAALAGLLARAEADPAFHAELARRSRELSARVRPERERAAWERLLSEAPPATPRQEEN